MISLKQKIALITGGSRGIGRAAAWLLAKAGADVAISYRNRSFSAEEVTTSIEALGRRALGVQADVSREADVERLVESTLAELGPIDILVANAGIWKRAPLTEMSEADWDETLDINLKGVYLAAKHVGRIMAGRRSGRMILISSTAGQRGEPYYSHYAASKGGIISLTKSLAVELAPHRVRVNCVAPGWVETDMTTEALSGPGGDEIRRAAPLGRVGTPEEIAGAILFLASDLAAFVNGEVLNVNGGSVLAG